MTTQQDYYYDEVVKRLVQFSVAWAVVGFAIMPYITITPTFSICPKHGYLAGEHAFCPVCDEEKLAEKRRRLAA